MRSKMYDNLGSCAPKSTKKHATVPPSSHLQSSDSAHDS